MNCRAAAPLGTALTPSSAHTQRRWTQHARLAEVSPSARPLRHPQAWAATPPPARASGRGAAVVVGATTGSSRIRGNACVEPTEPRSRPAHQTRTHGCPGSGRQGKDPPPWKPGLRARGEERGVETRRCCRGTRWPRCARHGRHRALHRRQRDSPGRTSGAARTILETRARISSGEAMEASAMHTSTAKAARIKLKTNLCKGRRATGDSGANAQRVQQPHQ